MLSFSTLTNLLNLSSPYIILSVFCF
jgi:hypothetical protein